MIAKDGTYRELLDDMHRAFEAALVACMDYFRAVWDEKDREIASLKERLAAIEAKPNDR